MVNERENEDFKTLAGILVGVGFLLILISFGARRKRKGGAKKTEKKSLQLSKGLKSFKECISLNRFSPNLF